MTWFLFSLGAALMMASTSAWMKRFFSDVSPWEMGVIPFFYCIPLCGVALLFIDIPEIGPGFFPAMSWLLPVNLIAIILHFRAIHISPLSLTIPYLSFTPVFVIFTANLMLDESLKPLGIVGVLLVVLGGYVINLDATRHGFLGPVKAIWREPGSAMMLVVALLYSFCSVGGKLLILNSSPLFAAMFLYALYGVCLTAILVGVGKAKLATIVRRPLLGLGAGIIIFLEVICHNLAISLVAAAYMVTIKRMAGIFSVIYGRILFNERGLRYRLLGTSVMTAGAAVIALYG